ncbi:response regulator [Candidatus Micrarchaeota archaeon]|nr:response regulator [Candidatus Micrarchaeota archaeon]
MTPKRILYVEDNRDTAQAVAMMLDKSGFSTEIAYTGKKGLELAFSEKFDLILLDVMLPDMSGWDIFEELQNKGYLSKYAFLSVIPLSNKRRAELAGKGVTEYIQKPFEKSFLISRVSKLLLD